ncbi:hypothetical protein [Halobacterium zhouii]|uniref:hypothetical protein n=1 Tax=Halobacterium zhouii TaxID=2902624 RepID=UPI001E583CC9|nr:hypothetical protein [Halobacterium zhouii]
MRDFTLAAYGELLDACLDAGFELLTVREYLTRETLPERFVVLRHDVDRKPGNSLATARMEASRGIRATYYFRTIKKTFRTGVVQQVANAGHEVGYHHEDVDRADGDQKAAHRHFEDNLAQLRRLCAVDTVCVHDNPLTGRDNRDIWRGERTPADYGLLGEASRLPDGDDEASFSDAGRTWRDSAPTTAPRTAATDGGAKPVQADSTWDLVGLLEDSEVERVYLCTHPNRWADSYSEYVAERARDSAVNAVKYGFHMLP